MKSCTGNSESTVAPTHPRSIGGKRGTAKITTEYLIGKISLGEAITEKRGRGWSHERSANFIAERQRSFSNLECCGAHRWNAGDPVDVGKMPRCKDCPQ